MRPSDLTLIIDELMLVEPGTAQETVFVHGAVSWVAVGYFDICLTAGTRKKDIRFLSSLIKYQLDSPCTALVEIPKGLVDAFHLSDFVLDEAALAKRRKHVDEYNAPKLMPSAPERKPERIGSVRI